MNGHDKSEPPDELWAGRTTVGKWLSQRRQIDPTDIRYVPAAKLDACERGHLRSACSDGSGWCIECSIVETGRAAVARLEAAEAERDRYKAAACIGCVSASGVPELHTCENGTIRDERDALKAKVGRLQVAEGEAMLVVESAEYKLGKALAEVAQLREALDQIVAIETYAGAYCSECHEPRWKFTRAVDVARSVLAKTTPSDTATDDPS